MRPRMEMLPNQSIAFKPSSMLVLGLWTSKNSRSSRKVNPWMGRLIHQFHLQDTNSVNAPPRIGPIPAASAQTNSSRPKYKLLFRTLKRSLTTMFTRRMRPPPAVPWMARPAISIFILTASAQRMEDAKKTETATSRIGFRPHISEKRAQICCCG